MLPSVKNEDGAKTKVPSKRELKKRINIRWNSGIFFQVGLVVIMLLTYFVMQSDWDLGAKIDYQPRIGVTVEDPPSFVFQIEVPKIAAVKKPNKAVEPRVITKAISAVITVADDNSNANDTPLTPTEIIPGIAATATGVVVAKKVEKPSHYSTVQFVPVFPGCESLRNNTERRQCMSAKVTKLINRHFKTDKFPGLEQGKVHKVQVQFTIGKDGMVKDVLARAVEPELEQEAKRVIGKMPLMQPGKQGNTAVDVLFTVPIAFKVE